MVSIRNYFTIFILMVMIFVMFMFAGVSSNLLSDTSTNSHAQDKVDFDVENSITANSLNLSVQTASQSGNGREAFAPEKKQHVAILAEAAGGSKVQLLIEWCVYNKYMYQVFNDMPAAKIMENYDIVLFGDYAVTVEDTQLLYSYAGMGKTMIFTQLPSYRDLLANRRLASFFGIQNEVEETVTADGIKVFAGFMMNKERIYKKGDYFGDEDDTQITVPYYTLSPGYEVYAVGILNNQDELAIEDKDLPPLLWRTTTGKSFVYVINSDIFRDMSMLGVLTGFMSHVGEFYVYPIVNAQTISLIDYPYFSDENSETLQEMYSRTSEAVARDLLWPNIIQILKNYGGSYSFFAAPQLDYQDEVGAKENYIRFYLREIGKLPGNMGLSLGQVSDSGLTDIITENRNFFKDNLPDYKFTALYAADFSTKEIENNLKNELLQNISLIMSDYKEGDNLLGFIDDNVLSVKFNLDGYQHETRDNLRMNSIENALGMCNVKVDIGRVLYPRNDSDEWNNLSLKWSKGDTYFKDFSMLDMVPIYELEKRVKRFLTLDYTCEYGQNDVSIQIDHFDEEAYFILSTNNRTIERIENGTAEKISDTLYLIKASEPEVRIQMLEDNVLQKPKNNKRILSTPENSGQEEK